MLNKIITLVFILPALTTIAQSPDVFLIGTGGGMTGTSGLYVSYSLCEPFISMAQNNGHWNTEGFQQPAKINLATGNATLTHHIPITVYPNPVSSELHAKGHFLSHCDKVSIANLLGYSILYEPVQQADEIRIPISHLAPGLYWLIFECDEEELINVPFIKM